MAIFNTMIIQPLARIKRPGVYVTTPTNSMTPPVTETKMRAILEEFEAPKPGTTAMVKKTAAVSSLMFQWPPKRAVPLPPPQIRMIRYHLYHMDALRVGNAVVKTEGGIKVVYMTPEAATFYLAGFVIGMYPWASLNAVTKYAINQLHHQTVA
jgi:hypothetical protein